MNIPVPLAVTATTTWRGVRGVAAWWRGGVAHMARTVRHSAAVVFSALITLLAAAGVALCAVHCYVS